MRSLVSMLAAATACVLLAGCGPEDAAAAKVAADALKNRVDLAVTAHCELIARARFEERLTRAELINKEVSDSLAKVKLPGWSVDEAKLRKVVTYKDHRVAAKEACRGAAKPVLDAVEQVRQTAMDYEAAWPLGTDTLACMKQGMFVLTGNLRAFAASFDPEAKKNNRYIVLKTESSGAVRNYEAALKTGQGAPAATALQAFGDLLDEERAANLAVQASYVQAAQAAADMYTAIEAAQSFSLRDALRLVQRYAPKLTEFDDTLDGAAIAAKAGVTLGKVEESDWLKQFAGKPLATVQCNQSK